MLCNRIILFFYTIFNFSSCNRITFNNNKKKKVNLINPKLEFLKTQKFINLEQRCKKKKIHQKIEREREPFCEGKLCK